MNYRLQRKQARLGLEELSGQLGVPAYWLSAWERGAVPWPTCGEHATLQRRYERLIAEALVQRTQPETP